MSNSQNFCLLFANAIYHTISKMPEVTASKILTERMPGQRLIANTRKRLLNIRYESITQVRLLLFMIGERFIQLLTRRL